MIYSKILLIYLLIQISAFKTKAENILYIKVSLTDCTNCYQGLSILQNNLLDELPKSNYVFKYIFLKDREALIDRFNIDTNKATMLFSDSLYKKIEKNEFSELVLFKIINK